MPAWLTWAALKNLPWGKIFMWLAIAAVVIAVVLYIRNAEENRASVKTLKTENAALVTANAELEAAHKLTVDSLQSSIKKAKEREKSYAAAIEEIETQEDTGCARSSPALRATIRLLRSRHGN